MKKPQERFNKLTQNLPSGKGNFEIYALANKLEEKGEKVIHMEIGRPDFPTPELIKAAAIQSIKDNKIYYTSASGISELKKAIVYRENNKGGLKYNPEDEVVVTVGASEALHCIWMTFLNPEDEVLIPSPFYNSYKHQLTYSKAKLIPVQIIKDDRIEYLREDFENKINENTKMIVLNNPNNPTGYVMTHEEIKMISEIAIKYDLLVISDECYDAFVYDGKFESVASFPGMKERTLTVNSTSKTFAMTGWRIGFVLGNSELITQITKMHTHLVICPTSFAQHGAIAAFNNVYTEVENMKNEYKERRKIVIEELGKIPEISFIPPKGAFYVYFSVKGIGMNGMDFCEEILEKKRVALSPGQVYGADWQDYIRLAYTCSREDIMLGIKKIREFINEKVCAMK